MGRGGLSCSLACNGSSIECFINSLFNIQVCALSSFALEPQQNFVLCGSEFTPQKINHSITKVIEWFIKFGQGWIRTTVDSRRQIYSLLPLATRAPTQISCPSYSFLSKRIAGNRNRTYNLRFTKPLLYRWAMPAYIYCIYKIILCQVIFFDFLQFILINMLEVVQIEDFYITFAKFF